MKDILNYQLQHNNTFGIVAKCKRFIEFETEDEAFQTAEVLRSEQEPFIILGGGSNLLLTRDFDGVVVRSAIQGLERVESPLGTETDVLVRCGSGEEWDKLVAQFIENGWYGAENLSAIPGDVGASAVQNIGAYGVEVKDLIYKVEAIEIATGKKTSFPNAECQYSYRQSKFKHGWKNKYLITHVTYRLGSTFTPNMRYGNISEALSAQEITNPTAQQLRETIIKIRNEKLPDPKIEGNAGSFFMNPIVERSVYERLKGQYGDTMPHYVVDEEHIKIPAGWMIEQCGWKGKTLGRAGVHAKQALVLVNKGGATGEEIVSLCDAIRSDVKEKFGIDIHPEVNIY